MIASRRLTLQLTPLLDLMLIVMFAQYMELRIVALQEAERVATQQQAATADNEELRQRLDEYETAQRQSDLKRQQEVEQVGQIVRELFRVPQAVLNKLIQPRSQGEGGLTSDEIADLMKRFQQLAAAQGNEVVDHLLTYNEMRKQLEIWEFYLNEEGELIVTLGSDHQQIQSKVLETPEAFIHTVLELHRRFPPTRNVVLILCRYGDCPLQYRLSMIRGLPVIAERLRNDGKASTRFEYAVLGYRPQSDLK